MVLFRNVAIILMVCAVFPAAGCKGKSNQRANARVPISQDPLSADDVDEQEDRAAEARQEQEEALRLLGSVDEDEPDQGVAHEKNGPTEDEIRAEQEREAKKLAATEQAITSAINMVRPQVLNCLSKSEAASGAATVRLKVHRAGYVLDTNVSGVGGECAACLNKTLGDLKVAGMQTDTLTVTRRFAFRNR